MMNIFTYNTDTFKSLPLCGILVQGSCKVWLNFVAFYNLEACIVKSNV